MARKKSTDRELKDQRIPIMMTPSELEAIDDWSFKNRIRSRGEAVRRLCQMGIIFDREVKPMVDATVEHIRSAVAGERPPLSTEERDNMFKNMSISLFNAGTVAAKLSNDIPTDEAIKSLTDLYAYYERVKKEGAD